MQEIQKCKIRNCTHRMEEMKDISCYVDPIWPLFRLLSHWHRWNRPTNPQNTLALLKVCDKVHFNIDMLWFIQFDHCLDYCHIDTGEMSLASPYSSSECSDLSSKIILSVQQAAVPGSPGPGKEGSNKS